MRVAEFYRTADKNLRLFGICYVVTLGPRILLVQDNVCSDMDGACRHFLDDKAIDITD